MRIQFVLGRFLVKPLLAVAAAVAMLSVAASAPGTALGTATTLSAAGAYPSIARSASGNFVAAWLTNENLAPRQIQARLFAAGGTPLAAQFVVSSGPISDFQYYAPPALAMDAAGDFVVAWLGGPDSVYADDHIYAQAYAAGGTPRGGIIDVAAAPHPILQSYADLQHPAVAMHADGSFVVAWISNSQYSPTNGYPDLFYNNTTLHAQRYAADASPQGAAVTVTSLINVGPEKDLILDNVRIAMSSSGDYAMVWEQSALTESIYGAEHPLLSPYYARFYSAAGVPVSLPLNLPIDAAGLKYLMADEFAASRDAAGELLLAWATADSMTTPPMQETLYLRRYSRLGLPLAAAATVATRGPHDEYPLGRSIQLAPDAAGGVAVAWIDYPSADYARYFAADGSPAGASFPIAAAASWNLDALSDAQGNLLAAWDESAGNELPAGILAQRFQGP